MLLTLRAGPLQDEMLFHFLGPLLFLAGIFCQLLMAGVWRISPQHAAQVLHYGAQSALCSITSLDLLKIFASGLQYSLSIPFPPGLRFIVSSGKANSSSSSQRCSTEVDTSSDEPRSHPQPHLPGPSDKPLALQASAWGRGVVTPPVTPVLLCCWIPSLFWKLP